jgi:hypothetical protein
MHTPFIIFYLAIVLAVGAGRVGADMVILKSGEMFQTPRAWKENGAVNYFKDGRVVRVDEDQVDRLIHSPAPAEEKPMPEHLPESDRSLPLENPAAGRARLPADGDAGYLGLRWGQPLSRVEGLTPTGTDPAYGGCSCFPTNSIAIASAEPVWMISYTGSGKGGFIRSPCGPAILWISGT